MSCAPIGATLIMITVPRNFSQDEGDNLKAMAAALQKEMGTQVVPFCQCWGCIGITIFFGNP